MENKPHIRIIGTGGTIAFAGESSADYEPEHLLSLGELLSPADQVYLESVARISGEELFAIGSTAITQNHWLLLAERLRQTLADDDIQGVVITHGTDTMEETAYLLHLLISSEKPVIITGAMRSAASAFNDGPANIRESVLAAAHPQSRSKGVLLISDGLIFSAREVIKSNTHRIDAFNGGESGCLGRILGNHLEYIYSPAKRFGKSSEFATSPLPQNLAKVDIVYGYPESGISTYAAAVEAGAKGIVIAASGAGIIHPELCAYLQNNEHPPTVRASRVFGGGTAHDYLAEDSSLGTIAAGSLSPQKARVLLQLALNRTKDLEELRRIFQEY